MHDECNTKAGKLYACNSVDGEALRDLFKNGERLQKPWKEETMVREGPDAPKCS